MRLLFLKVPTATPHAVATRQTNASYRTRRGFTLIELMVVAAIAALASVGVTISLRDSVSAQLGTEVPQLASLLIVLAVLLPIIQLNQLVK
jgi:prepilin-type N-terminal cleavage/methylation domain-containing protein